MAPHYLSEHWSLDPFALIVGSVAILHETGLQRLARRSRAPRNVLRRRRSVLFYAGLLTLLLAVMSPLDYWADDYFFVHMIQHLLLMFAAPSLIVAGAPWLPLVHGIPLRARRSLGRFVILSTKTAPLRAIGRVVLHPTTAFVAFNGAMIGWHVPVLFDAAYRNQGVHIWLMHGSFFVTGVLFWLQVIPSYPLRPRLHPLHQAGMLIATDALMIFLAMSMSLFSNASWYPVYNHLPGVTLSPFADQQLGAAILWVCGDFWALPALFVVVGRFIQGEGGLSEAFERVLRRPALTVADLSDRPVTTRRRP